MFIQGKIFHLKKESKALNVDVTDKQLKTLLLGFNGADIDTLFNLAFQFSETSEINHQSIQKAVYEIQKRKKI